jgi:hypothetical protein
MVEAASVYAIFCGISPRLAYERLGGHYNVSGLLLVAFVLRLLDIASQRRYRDGGEYREDDDDDDEFHEGEASCGAWVPSVSLAALARREGRGVAGMTGEGGTLRRRLARAPCGRFRARKSRRLGDCGIGSAVVPAVAAAIREKG